MSKIIFIGDPHFDDKTPLSRLDAYPETSLIKLNNVLQLAINKDVRDVIMLGDVFDKYNVGFNYLNSLVDLLRKFADNNIRIHSIVGNHDLPYNNKKYFENTPLYTLFVSGVVSYLTELDLGNTVIYGLDFGDAAVILDELKEKATIAGKEGKTTILSMHYALFNTIPGESLDINELRMFDIIAAGHDHKYYPIETVGNTQALRPGSFIRRTKDDYNLVRDVIVYLVDTDNKQVFEEKILSAKPANQVFKNEVFINISEKQNDFSKIFNQQFFEKSLINLDEMVEELPITITASTKNEIKQFIKENK